MKEKIGDLYKDDEKTLKTDSDKEQMRIGRTNVEDQVDTMNNILTHTEKGKSIVVVIDSNLSLSDHLGEKVNKANRIMGIIRREFVYLDMEMFKTFYTVIVRPHLEYANQIWCHTWSKILTF